LIVVGVLVGGRGGVAGAGGDGAVEAAVVEPVDVFQGGELDVADTRPGAVVVDEFPLVEAVERFGQGIRPARSFMIGAMLVGTR
jgi:hypothetical protein